MGTPGAASAAGTRIAGASRRLRRFAAARSEDRELLHQLLRSALWTGGSLPFAGSDQDFAVGPAFPAMKLIDRHTPSIAMRRVPRQREKRANQPARAPLNSKKPSHRNIC